MVGHLVVVVCAVTFLDSIIVLLCCSTSRWLDVAVFSVVARTVMGVVVR